MVVEGVVPKWPAGSPDFPTAANAETPDINAPAVKIGGAIAAGPAGLIHADVDAVPVGCAIDLEVVDVCGVVLPPTVPLIVAVILNILPAVRAAGPLRARTIAGTIIEIRVAVSRTGSGVTNIGPVGDSRAIFDVWAVGPVSIAGPF